MRIQFGEIIFQIISANECLILVQKQRRRSFMELVARSEGHTKWKVIEIRNINFVSRAFPSDEVSAQSNAEEQIDQKQVGRVRRKLLDRGTTVSSPSLHHCPT